MVDVIIKDNVKQFTKKLNRVERQQIPFATSRAINDTAVSAQESLVKGVVARFDNKKKWWIKSNRRTGIRVEFSNKNKKPLKSSVYTNAYFAELQEKGGIKAPRSGGVLAVPTSKTPKGLRRSDGVERAKAKGQVFVSKQGVYKRMARGRVKKLFNWVRVANVRPRFMFEVTAKQTVQRTFPERFKLRLEQALRSARL